ncbi:uncharacterized protein LOC121934033 [Sceloporus undulatus]|uniref:uncharacterized protein LOC121934033 n=1 Tax=Sceloporus undulatus TaxID=8520 RepID=UPI001C4D28B4|nr:uncharacterized protein LOC121934033 [Sceloporus undulatus]
MADFRGLCVLGLVWLWLIITNQKLAGSCDVVGDSMLNTRLAFFMLSILCFLVKNRRALYTFVEANMNAWFPNAEQDGRAQIDDVQQLLPRRVPFAQQENVPVVQGNRGSFREAASSSQLPPRPLLQDDCRPSLYIQAQQANAQTLAFPPNRCLEEQGIATAQRPRIQVDHFADQGYAPGQQLRRSARIQAKQGLPRSPRCFGCGN